MLLYGGIPPSARWLMATSSELVAVRVCLCVRYCVKQLLSLDV